MLRGPCILVLALSLAACGKRAAPAPSAAASVEPIQCWRRSGMKPPGERLAIARALLAKGRARVYLDPQASGIALPPARLHDLRTVLVVSADVPNLVVDDAGIAGSFVFDGKPFATKVPWSAVYALTSDAEGHAEGGVWEESVPHALFCQP